MAEPPFKILWNPWRYEYVKSTLKKKDKCIFCELPKFKDEEAYIIYRGKYSYIVLNTYPYNSGHLMIVPYRHVDTFEKLTEEETTEITALLKKILRVLREVFSPEGFNIGVNIGRAAGAGVEGHIHIHVVPRWTGDSNFMFVIGNTKTIPISLEKTYELLKSKWIELYGGEALDH